MTPDEFWSIIDRASAASEGSHGATAEALGEEPSKRTPDGIVEFQCIFDERGGDWEGAFGGILFVCRPPEIDWDPMVVPAW